MVKIKIMKTTTIQIEEYKDTGLMEHFHDLFASPGMSDDESGGLSEKCSKVFEYGEYLNAEIVVDENLNIIGGKIFPYKENWNEKINQ